MEEIIGQKYLDLPEKMEQETKHLFNNVNGCYTITETDLGKVFEICAEIALNTI